jgi:hypothetical protein
MAWFRRTGPKGLERFANQCASLCTILNRNARIETKAPAAVALGRKGGRRSRINLRPEQRLRLARKAAAARCGKKKQQHGK